MSQHAHPTWPVLTRYDQAHLARIALPLGGIGTGTVSLGGRGDLRDWEIVNRPSKGFAPRHTFFASYTRSASGQTITKALEGRIEPPYEGPDGCSVPNAGLPRFRACEFHAAYPFGQVLLSDPDVPVAVTMQAFNPLIPADAQRSGIPVALVRFLLTNTGDQALTASVCGSIQNFIGFDGVEGAANANENIFQQAETVQGVFMRSQGVHPLAEQSGTMALSTTASAGVTYRTSWLKRGWSDALLDFWDDFSADGNLEERASAGVDDPMASLCVQVELPPRSQQAITFLLTWHYPNRQTWTPDLRAERFSAANRVGNYYTTSYTDAWDVAVRTAEQLAELEEDTHTFVSSFCATDLPQVVKEAALYNLSTLRTQTCFRTEDGNFYGWEGCNNTQGWCHGSCTHVWNYEQATAFLFGDLARRMRTIEFLHATNDEGLMSFRVKLPLQRGTEEGIAAADGQMGCIMKLYRDWQLSGDTALLQTLWPKARKALEFCWRPGGWDADQDGVMEGCQHNTMDVEYYGPNPQMGLWYLGALRAAEEMARFLGETDFAARCRTLFEQGSRWLDDNLFNGEYFEQKIQPPSHAEAIAPGLRLGAGASNLTQPEYQLGTGCLIDQLVGQYMAHICGLGYLIDRQHIHQTLQSIMRYNFQETLANHFNNMRTYALNDEAAILMCTYPKGDRPRQPFPYFNEVMTGFEYTACVHMLYEDLQADGLRGISAIRARYDGCKRNPFDEAECGYHYARAMASWAAVLALSGFHYSALDYTLRFALTEGQVKHFWSNGSTWGTCALQSLEEGVEVTIHVLYGTLHIQRLVITDVGQCTYDHVREIGRGEQVILRTKKSYGAPKAANH